MKTNKIPDEDLAWLQAHKRSVERRTRMLKGTGVFLYCFALAFAITAFFILISDSFALFLVVAALLIALFLTSAITPNKYINEMLIGSVSGVIVGVAITLIYIAPIVSVMQYPLTIQVFYPNHPNMTITQNCTGFTTSESGYLNGQPINETNTTTCILPHSIANTTYPFTCSIQNKAITCNAANYYIWQGTILNVSKR